MSERRRWGGWGWPTRAVALVAAALTVTACGIPTGAPTVIAKADVPFHLLTPSTSPGTTTPPVGVPENIYLVAPTGHVTTVSRDVTVPTESLGATIDGVLVALLDGPTAEESAAGLQTFLVTGSKPDVSTTVSGTTATVNFSANPVPAGSPNQALAIAQIVYTATQFGINLVSFEIAGVPKDVPTGTGTSVPGPVSRYSYQPQAPL